MYDESYIRFDPCGYSFSYSSHRLMVELTKETTKRVCCAQNGIISGETRDWTYSNPALVVREIIPSSEERYPVLLGEDIDGITVTDYKLEVCWKDKSRPTLIFLLKDDFIRCTDIGNQCFSDISPPLQ